MGGFPNIIYGDFGEEKTTYSVLPSSNHLGQLMVLPDGRKFRLAQAGGTALKAGAVVSVSAGLAAAGNVASSGLIASATTTYNLVGHTDVYVATSLAAFTKDQFAEGYLNVQGPAASTYIGHVYAVKSNASCAVSTENAKITLYDSDPLKVSFKAGTTTCSLRRNPFKDQIVAASITTITGSVPVAVSASHYFWCQRSGVASGLTAGTTVTDGAPVAIGNGQAGSVTVAVAVSLATQHIVGQALESVTATEAAMIDLNLE